MKIELLAWMAFFADSGLARAAPARLEHDYDLFAEQSPGNPRLWQVLGEWHGSWLPRRPVAQGLDAVEDASRVLAVDWLFSFPATRLRFTGNGEFEAQGPNPNYFRYITGWIEKSQSNSKSLFGSLELGFGASEERCGIARVSHSESLSEKSPSVLVRQHSRGPIISPYPLCGQRMVEMVEEHDGLRFQTCVDRAYPAAEAVSQLTMIFSEGALEWALSPMPFRPDEIAPTPAAPGVWWPVSQGCNATFATRTLESLPGPSANTAYQMTWDGPDTLVSVQLWRDDRETGAFYQLYEDGRIMTVGYRHDGQHHGFWWYFAPDGSLLDVRIYALGVEVARLPVETVRDSPTP